MRSKQIQTPTKPPIHRHQIAGKLMTTAVPMIHEHATIRDAEALLFDKKTDFDTINYLYLVNGHNRLKGVVSIKELFRRPKNAALKMFSPKSVVMVHEHINQERVAYLALKHNLKAIPVVDKRKNLLGVISSDTILAVLDNKSIENILRFGGIMHGNGYDDIFHLSLLKSLLHRLPWLTIGLLGGLFASSIVHGFEAVLSKNLILAAFIPLIVYISDAVGTQMEAFMIRDLAINESIKFGKYFFRQFSIIFLISCILAVILYVATGLVYREATLSLVISIAMFFSIMSSLTTGLLVPYLFHKLNFDAANASGPIATIIQDIISVFIYFTIASLLL